MNENEYLDENKQLILAILENQNSGKADECAENQAKLQRNLMYLAAIADSQPQVPTIAQQQQQQAAMHSQLAMSSGGNNSSTGGFTILHGEASIGGNGSMNSGGVFGDFGRSSGGKQETGSEGHGTETPMYLKGSEEEGN
ncbi:uncharacterized protein A4U43_C06F19560 [Asparagus officinalis]|uniref:SS18 N-terminal domain-containing protein n=1 Tax=Asparagus officinalis TaxID=4686 RepID=A0A5P1ERM0_ASPOF|nr:uncharacterized protein A4U43_C06F19560 [Asparagus officinalis]